MIQFYNTRITNVVVHFVGNKNNDEKVRCSRSMIEIDDSIEHVLINYFIRPFLNLNELYSFVHGIDLQFNEVYSSIISIFDNSETFFKQSTNLSKHLYELSTHPKIKGGEFYVVYFKDCIVDGITTDAVGLFKSENKDTFLKVYPKEDSFAIESEKGVNINKLDKGCLIFNIEKESGYVVSVVDNTNKGAEAKYWLEDFLNVKPRNDEYAKTQSTLTLYKSFITKKVSEDFGMNKAEQAALLNKSLVFFKENTEISLSDFAKEVIKQPELIESFNQYKNQYEKEHRVSESAVKKQARKFRSVIKLDKNFHIYVHGDEHLIEQGEDKDGWKYYKIFYREES